MRFLRCNLHLRNGYNGCFGRVRPTIRVGFTQSTYLERKRLQAMKRGFFDPPARTRPPATSSLQPAASHVNHRDASSGSSLHPASQIAVSSDHTAIYDDSSLVILHADYRLDRSPYFGYFPPLAKEPSMVFIDSDIERIEAAADWKVWHEPDLPELPEEDKCFEIRSVEGKGKAMFAKRSIPAGTDIQREVQVYLCLFGTSRLTFGTGRPFYISIQTKNIAPDQGTKNGLFHRSAASKLGPKQRRDLLALSNCYKPDVRVHWTRLVPRLTF